MFGVIEMHTRRLWRVTGYSRCSLYVFSMGPAMWQVLNTVYIILFFYHKLLTKTLNFTGGHTGFRAVYAGSVSVAGDGHSNDNLLIPTGPAHSSLQYITAM